MGFSAERFRAHLALAGYVRREAPLVDDAAIFLTKGGDRVIDRLITFDRGRRTFALRPEFTASAATEYVREAGGSVVRWQFAGPIFQEPEQVGGSFVQHQLGAELIGARGADADAEMIGVIHDGLHRQGLDRSVRFVVGHSGLTLALLESYGLDPQITQFLLNQRGLLAAKGAEIVWERLKLLAGGADADLAQAEYAPMVDTLMAITPRTSAFGGRTREEIARRFIQKRHRLKDMAAIERAVAFLADWVQIEGEAAQVWQSVEARLSGERAEQLYAQWRQSLAIVEAYGLDSAQLILRPDLSRVWDYYTGITFELRTLDGLPLGGGGRYDGLMRLFGDPNDTPAIGFGLDVDALQRSYGHDRVEEGSPLTVTLADHLDAIYGASVARALRAEGICVVRQPAGSAQHIHIGVGQEISLDDVQVSSIEQLITVLKGKTS